MGLKVRNKLWLISDTHFGHRNIIKFCQRPETHEVIMLSNWIDRVGETDQILHLGDVVMRKDGNSKRWLKVISRLPGEKFLIRGNHDFTLDDPYLIAGFTIVDAFVYDRVAFTHRPMSVQYNEPAAAPDEWDVNIHGHTHNNEYKPEHDGTLIEGKTYLNVCVEHTDLAPVQLGNIYARKWSK